MRPVTYVACLIALFLATGATACVAALRQESAEDSISVEIKPLYETYQVDRGISFEVKVTNTLDRPVRFMQDLGAATLSSAIDSNGKVYRLLCDIEVLNCENVSIENTVLLAPGSFYGQRLYVSNLDLIPGVYQFGVSVALQSCPDWPFSYNEYVETERVEIVVDE